MKNMQLHEAKDVNPEALRQQTEELQRLVVEMGDEIPDPRLQRIAYELALHGDILNTIK